jgi:hypothetical protein
LKTTYPDEHISSQNFDCNKNAPDLGKETGMRIIAESKLRAEENFTDYTYVRVFPLNIIGGAIAAMTQNPT